MPRFTGVIFTSQVNYGEAVENLNAMPDDELVRRVTYNMVPFLAVDQDRSWNPVEPEHDQLPHLLRTQIRNDLTCLYSGGRDVFCDELLASTYTDGRVGLVVLYDDDECDEDGNFEHEQANPVVRLKALGICNARNEITEAAEAINRIASNIRITPLDTGGFPQYIAPRVQPQRRIVYTTGTTANWNPSSWNWETDPPAPVDPFADSNEHAPDDGPF